jgi:2-polyprenyl-6-hydroxyphenyl methylase/3-demethylubiquinone-9 3-methyltransferase
MSTLTHASTIDPQELPYYERLADTWWDKGGPFWPLHLLNALRVDYIVEILCRDSGRDPRQKGSLEGLSLLDVGCGGGILSEALAERGATVHGIDIVERNIHIAKLHAAKLGSAVDYSLTTVEDLAAQGKQYDVVLAMEVVEHVADLTAFISACAQLVKPKGRMFIATINRTALSWLTAIVGAEYVLRWLPRGTHRWRKFPKPREVEAMTKRNGLRTTDRCGVRINPLTRKFALTSFLGVNYMLALEKAVTP